MPSSSPSVAICGQTPAQPDVDASAILYPDLNDNVAPIPTLFTGPTGPWIPPCNRCILAHWAAKHLPPLEKST